MAEAPAIDPRLEPLLALLAELVVRDAVGDHPGTERREPAGEVGREAA